MSVPSLFRRGRQSSLPVRREESPLWEFQQEVNRLFEDFWRGFDLAPMGWAPQAMGSFSPRIELDEDDEEVRVTAELPGLDEKDFELTLNPDSLILRGEKRAERQEEGKGWHRSERVYGRFERHIPLPCEVDEDKASAEYKNGVLTVHLPKSPEARKRRVTIPVRAS